MPKRRKAPTFVTLGIATSSDMFKAMLTAENGGFRPIWATRAPLRKRWDALTGKERSAAMLLLHGFRPNPLPPVLKLPAADVPDAIDSFLAKLGFGSILEVAKAHAGAAVRRIESAKKRKRRRLDEPSA